MRELPDPADARSPFEGKTGVIRIFHAFLGSCDGLADAWRNESAFRQELWLAAVLVPVARVVLTPVWAAILLPKPG